MAQRQLLACEGEHGRVGEMEQGRGRRKHQERPVRQEHAPARRVRSISCSDRGVEAARPLMVNGVGRNGQDALWSRAREERHQIKHRPLRECGADSAGDRGDRQVTYAVEGGVPPEPSGEPVRSDKTQRDRGNSRRENAAEHGHR